MLTLLTYYVNIVLYKSVTHIEHSRFKICVVLLQLRENIASKDQVLAGRAQRI